MAQSGSALGWGPSGRRFKSCLPDLSDSKRSGDRLTAAERYDVGRAVRKRVSRGSLGAFTAMDELRDPVEILRAEDVDRVPELLPIRYGRMLTTPLAFYRGSAALMAHDLAGAPHTDIFAQLCGDAHLSNFGLFAAPDRRLVFDCDDFDETLPGPWEWDVKRLCASLVIAARSIDASPNQADEAARAASAAYRERMQELALLTNLEVFNQRIEVEAAAELLRQSAAENPAGAKAAHRNADAVEAAAKKAYTHDSAREFKRLTHVVDGRRKIIAAPPLIVPLDDVGGELGIDVDHEAVRRGIEVMFESYKSSLLADRRRLIDQYELIDVAHKVVGVGSVGTRAWIALLIGRDESDPLFLQLKEAGSSVLEPHLGETDAAGPAERVVCGQRMMQAATDPLLGHGAVVGLDGVAREFYVRQLKDWKGSAKIERFTPEQLVSYGEICARVLARAHARSGDRIAIAGYVGKGEALDRALAEFSNDYADQNDRDYARMKAAVKDGRLVAREGV